MKKVVLTIGVLMILLPAVIGQRYYQVRKQSRISTGMHEVAAVPYEDGVVYIAESTSVGASSPTDAEGRRLFTIFQFEGGQKKHLSEVLVTPRHEGPVSFTADFKTMVFSQQRPSGVNRDFDPLGLYFAENMDGEWVNIQAYEHNDDFAWLFSPALSPDGNTLFFSANYPEGLGGYDLYRSVFSGGSWSEPENLGPSVNTDGNEVYPYFHSSQKLYFSSDGHDNNIHGFDLFETTYIGGEWAGAVKLQPPLNSLSNDYHIYFNEDFKQGYITSNRQGGSKDIFTIETDIPPLESATPIKKTYYKYRIVDRKLDTIDTELFRYSWTINDTLEIPGHEVIYRFPGPGRYICKLNVYDIQLDTLVEGQTINTLNIKLHEQAVITCPDTIPANVEVVLDGNDTYLPNFDASTFYWEFGDGYYGEGKQVSHTYLYPGQYTVKLGVQARKKNRRDTDAEVRSSFKDIVVVAPE